MATLNLNKLIKRFGPVEVIHGVDLTINSGEFVVFVGPSGCGKSTLLRMIAGLESASDGDIVIDGDVVNGIPASQRGLAMVFQTYALYPHMTVAQNLAFGLENIRTPKTEIAQRVQQAATMLQIEELLERKPKQLSGGQRQRVAIGRAIVRKPKIFLFDEPLSNLDAELRVQMRVEIAALHGRLGNTMIYVTHDQVEAMTMADKIVVLRQGYIEQVGAPLEIFNRPANRFVAGFIGSPRMNMIEGTVAAIHADGVTVDLPHVGQVTATVRPDGLGIGAPITLGIRPQHIHVGAEATNTVSAAIRMVEHLGADTYLYCDLPGDHALTVHMAGQSDLSAGDTVPIALPAPDCHVFKGDGKEDALTRLAS